MTHTSLGAARRGLFYLNFFGCWNKKTEKNGIYAALDVGLIWLDRALKK